MRFQQPDSEGGWFVTSFSSDPWRDFGVFARGYSLAASSLAEDLLSRAGFADFEAYPVVFLYRHSLELYLKNVIYQSALLAGFRFMDGVDSRLHNTHDLVSLSEAAAELLRRLFPQDYGLEVFCEEMLAVSQDFSGIDGDSFAYRYPIDTQGRPSTPRGQSLNLAALCSVMENLLEDMDTIDFGLQVELSQAQELSEILNTL